MNRTLKIYLFLFAILIAGIIVVDQTREKPLDWSLSYHLDEKKPFDLYVLNQEIDHLLDASIVRYNKNPFEYFRQQDSLDFKQETYLFVKDFALIDEASVNKLLDAVNRGSTLFIISKRFVPHLLDTLRTDCVFAPYNNPVPFEPGSDDRPEIQLSFSKEAWSNTTYSYSTVFGQFAFLLADTTSATALGYMVLPHNLKYINFMEFQFGKGKIILHNQPVVLTNYSLLSNELSQEYAERVLSYLPDQPVIWFVESQQKEDGKRGKTQLSVVFDYPALRMTWLLFLYGLILFVIFTAKRKQRVIPIIKPSQNTTVEFTRTIGNLYFQEGNIPDIARKKAVYFLDRVRRTYNVDTRLLDDKFIQQLHFKSGKEMELIREMVFLINNVTRRGLSDKQELIELSMLIDRFWDNTVH